MINSGLAYAAWVIAAIGKPNIIHRQDTIICLDKKSSDFLQGDYLHFSLITPPIVMCS